MNHKDITTTPTSLTIKNTFMKGMRLEPTIYLPQPLQETLFTEHCKPNIISSLTQISNVSTLPSVKMVVGLPDIHSGYGFPIGTAAGFDLNDPDCIISPGGVGYDINCGVRCVATNLDLNDFTCVKKDEVANVLYEAVPSGMGKPFKMDDKIKNDQSKNNENEQDEDNHSFYVKNKQYVTFENTIKKFKDEKLFAGIKDSSQIDINQILENGLEYLVNMKIIDYNESLLVESSGKMSGNSHKISQKAKARGFNQMASLGSGNHYLEIQYVTEIYDKEKASVMGITKVNQIVFTIHTGSRGMGHQTCSDFLLKMNSSDKGFIDRQLAYSSVNSETGKDYLEAMASSANYAFCNRALIDKIARSSIQKIFPHVEYNLIYDVCHNIAKKERHCIDNTMYDLMVHRKGASRAFPSNHPDVPIKYEAVGQPFFVGGSMGTSSYILTGTEGAMEKTIGTSCHGAGRLLSRTVSKNTFTYEGVSKDLMNSKIVVRSGSKNGLVEEAPGCYKDVDIVVDLCEEIDISKKIVKVKPLIVIKG